MSVSGPILPRKLVELLGRLTGSFILRLLPVAHRKLDGCLQVEEILAMAPTNAQERRAWPGGELN